MASKLVRLAVVGGGVSPLPAGAKPPQGVDFYVLVPASTSTNLTVLADFNPPLSPADAAAAGVQWVGDGKPGVGVNQRLLTIAKTGRSEVACELGGVRKTVVVYAIGATPTGFRNNGPWSKDNEAKFVKAKTAGSGYELDLGVHPLYSAAKGVHFDTCEIQFTVAPPELIDDAKKGFFDTDAIRWRVTREAAETIWTQAPNGAGTPTWTERKPPSKYNVPAWSTDDTHTDDSDDDPWDTGHLYGTDAPGDDNLEKDDDAPPPARGQAPQPSGWVGYFAQRRFREFVVVGIGAANQSLAKMQRCSDYQYWHHVRRLAKTNGRWAPDPKGPNEIAKDDRQPVAP